jgi:hypothetical protein
VRYDRRGERASLGAVNRYVCDGFVARAELSKASPSFGG